MKRKKVTFLLTTIIIFHLAHSSCKQYKFGSSAVHGKIKAAVKISWQISDEILVNRNINLLVFLKPRVDVDKMQVIIKLPAFCQIISGDKIQQFIRVDKNVNSKSELVFKCSVTGKYYIPIIARIYRKGLNQKNITSVPLLIK